MIVRTGSRGVVCNMWTEAAREASIQARQAAKKGVAEQPNKFGRKTTPMHDAKDPYYHGQAYKSMSPEDKNSYSKASKNYQSLSARDKKQFHKDWEAAHAASETAAKSPSKETHTAAAQAHQTASKSAPNKDLSGYHKTRQVGHEAQAKSSGKIKATGTIAQKEKQESQRAGRDANITSERANKISKFAHDDKSNRAEMSHSAAASAHESAAKKQEAQGNDKQAKQHRAIAAEHRIMAKK